jgi:hypothetical protein
MGYLLISPSTHTTTAIRSPAASMTIRGDGSSGSVADVQAWSSPKSP